MRAALAALAAVAALTPVGAASAAVKHGNRLHDARYCEILELRGALPNLTVTVWNTIGLNKCPARWWGGFDAAQLAQERGDKLVVLNGPRHFLMDSATAATGRVEKFHGMRMRKVATIAIHSLDELAQTPYTDRVITRTNTWRWKRGRRVFELVAPGGDVYVMQSYAQIVDSSLDLADLRALGSRLHPPPGWRYRTRVLRRPLLLRARGSATILQDELKDTYQLARVTRPAGPRRRHAVKVTGKTKAVSLSPVEDRGTVTGEPFGNGRVLLNGTFSGGALNGTFRLTFPGRGSVIGTTAMPFTIAGNEIDFDGTSRFVAGTGIYRGITSGALATHDHNTLDGQNGVLSVTGAARY